jgi:hypothetical protein
MARARTARPSRPAADYAALAGISDASLEKNTGCTWDRWVPLLDYYDAKGFSHRDIARMVREKFKVGMWWSQAVAVGYERIKGLRAKGQRRDGTFEVSRSRTYSVPVKRLFDAWAKPRVRVRWLERTDVKVRSATAPKSMRLGWADGTIVALWFTAKGRGKSAVALAHARLGDRESAERQKQYWAGRLDRLGELLAEG